MTRKPCNYEVLWHKYKVHIPRHIQPVVFQMLNQFPAVAILGPRQVDWISLGMAGIHRSSTLADLVAGVFFALG
ncbi:MAG: hypothetical protein KGK08_06745, partial [Acidobacteriota bacterium]|nr:hypothetical protein [Acidobacteriota bacterium]